MNREMYEHAREATMTNTLRGQVESAIFSAEHQRAQGKLCNGRWHYLCATPDDKEPTGWAISQGEEISPCYSEAEYFSRPGAPVTFWTRQESDFGGPYYSGCVWEESTWEAGDYAHLHDDYEKHICLGGGFVAALFEAVDKGLVADAELPDDEDAAKAALVAAGFTPFVLGEWAEPIDLDEAVEDAMAAIESASTSEENQS